MTAFVLVHGVWHGGRCRRRLADALRARGHDPHAPTLTRLGERAHLASREAEVRRKLHVLAERNVGSIFRAVHERCARDPAWETARLPTMHDAMLEAPDALADLLIDRAERPAR